MRCESPFENVKPELRFMPTLKHLSHLTLISHKISCEDFNPELISGEASQSI